MTPTKHSSPQAPADRRSDDRTATPEPTPQDATFGSGEMFDSIAERYDFVTRVLSMVLYVRWR